MTRRQTYGFIAGFLATLFFHQLMLSALWQLGIAPFAPFSLKATWPFGIPAVLSLAFWGGIWGIIFVMVHRRFPRGGYWWAALLFGAIAPSLVALLVVIPLKGGPIGGGWHWPLLLTAAMVNGAWGIGTAMIYQMLPVRRRR